ncbi:MAG: hypothetical protein II660_05790, partial [Bacteroidales bacterium]|nr:hypothetical protein [Bacteroidales bacterium]
QAMLDGRVTYAYRSGRFFENTSGRGKNVDCSQYISLVMGVNMRKINLGSSEGIFEGYIELMVRDKRILEEMIVKLGTIDGIQSVTRTDI